VRQPPEGLVKPFPRAGWLNQAETTCANDVRHLRQEMRQPSHGAQRAPDGYPPKGGYTPAPLALDARRNLAPGPRGMLEERWHTLQQEATTT